MRNILEFIIWLIKKNLIGSVIIVSLLILEVSYLILDLETFKHVVLFFIGLFLGLCGINVIGYMVILPLKWAYRDFIKEKGEK